MHDLDAGRIFWKEWRAQRGFLIALFLLAVGLEFLLMAASFWRDLPGLDQLRVCHGLVIVLACSFAAGSTAIGFAGEVENKTKGLLQRIPVKARDLLAGKLTLSLAGSYALLFGLWAVGSLVMVRSNSLPSGGLPSDWAEEMNGFLELLLAPFVFVVVGCLISQLVSDVLLAAVMAAIATVCLLVIPAVRSHLALQAGVIAIVGVCDFLLARRWLHEVGAIEWRVWPQSVMPRVTFGPRLRTAERALPAESLRSAVAWRRGASSLIWKEFRQAFPFCLKLLVAGTIALGISVAANNSTWLNDEGAKLSILFLIAIAPLLPGIAAMRAERRGDAYRMLAGQGISPDGLLICKHLVWLGLSLAVFAILLMIDRSYLSIPAREGRVPSLWDGATEAVWTSYHDPTLPWKVISFGETLGAAAAYVVMLYALGFLLGLLLPGPVMAFFTGIVVLVGLTVAWTAVMFLGIPLWWTLGLLPVICLVAAWVRTPDWLIGRNSAAAWGKVAAVLVVPLVAIYAAIIVFRVTEIPAVAIPEAVLAPAAAGTPATQSPFAEAASHISQGPSAILPDYRDSIQKWGWQIAGSGVGEWVERNAAVRKLALAASQRRGDATGSPAEFDPDNPGAFVLDWQKQWWLTELLLFSARKMEFEGHLDDALACYVAVARLRHSPDLALDWARRWAAMPGQTTERVKKAIREFESLVPKGEDASANLLRDWRTNRRLLRKIVWEGSTASPKTQTVSELWWIRWFFPWELVRLQRLLDTLYATDLRETQDVESELARQNYVTVTGPRASRWRRVATNSHYEQSTLAWPEAVQLPWSGPQEFVDRLAIARMNLIALALADYSRVHQKLPESLSALVPEYFPRLPIDPWTAINFIYEPQGLPATVDFKNGRIDRGKPFLASAGMWHSQFVLTPSAGTGKTQVTIVDGVENAISARPFGSAPQFSGPAVTLPTDGLPAKARGKDAPPDFPDADEFN
jgi:hypothetical protein